MDALTWPQIQNLVGKIVPKKPDVFSGSGVSVKKGKVRRRGA